MIFSKQKVLHHGYSIITLEHSPDVEYPLVIKRSSISNPTQQYVKSLKNEFRITNDLGNIKGIRNAIEYLTSENMPALVLEYIQGLDLKDYLANKTIDLPSKLAIAIELTRILRDVHRKTITLLNLSSENIIVGADNQEIHIIDLGSSTHIDRSGQQKVQPEQMLGTLHYISPEQTGRINRAVDERSDLYSLGVVLYELMTHRLPFDSKDPLKLVHDHIARIPVSPNEVSSEIPKVLSAIILKLLSKDAEDRYQSAGGIQADLEKCLKRLSEKGIMEEFPLGENDYAGRLRFPQKIYGREDELKELERTFERVCRKSSSIVFVGGYSGIGKTTLVKELQRPVSEKNGYFIEGKFDQLVTTPYAGISKGLDLFISQILTQSETRLSVWRLKILEALGSNGKVLTNMVPSLELVIGPQPAVPHLSGEEAQNRFNYVFQCFFGAIANSVGPICLFLDDLQWIDPGSLDLLKALLANHDLEHLLVIGAYRNNEVHEDHPLMLLIADLEKAGANLKRMTLHNLTEADVESLISDTLGCDLVKTRELAGLIYSKTGGNMFFTRQVLRNLEDQDLLVLDTTTGNWRCDMDVLKDLDLTASVVELLERKLKQLPVAVQETLKVGACIGNQFDIDMLTAVTAENEKAILDHVQEAIAAGLIWERDDLACFVHDRVQEAAYALFPPEDRHHTHLTIGRHLLQTHLTNDHEQDLYQIVDQLNHGLHLVEDEHERMQIARLNLHAGRDAKKLSAYSASVEYLKRSASLLDKKIWQEHYPLALDVHNEWIEACYLAVQYPEVEVLFNKILEHGKQAVDLRIAFKTAIQMKIGIYEFNEAISLAVEFLERLEFSFDSSLDSRLSIDELYDLPVMKDKEKLAIVEILEKIINPMGFVASERFTPLIYTLLNTISNYGNCEVSSSVVTWYGTHLSAQGKYQEGYEYGQLGAKLLDKFPSPNMASGNISMQGAWIQPWISSIHGLITPLKEAGYVAIKQGVFENGCYNFINRLILMWSIGSPLPLYLSDAEECHSFCQRTNQEATRIITAMFAQAALNLSEKSELATKLEGKLFSEEHMLKMLEGNALVLGFYRLLKMTLSYLFGDSFEAYGHIEEALKSRSTLLFSNYYVFSKITFYGALSCIARLSNTDNDVESREILKKLELFEEELRLWAQSAPMNFQHQYDLVMAEKSMLNKDNWKAIQLYEAAIKGAKENRFVHEEALANELYARFWQKCGNDRIAETYLREAHVLYQQWGANAKVDHLEKCYPQWFQTESLSIGKPDVSVGDNKAQTSINQPITSNQLDMESIISASQMLSAEINLEQLLTKMITLVMANSGAEKTVLLLRQENDWFVQARGNSSSERYDVLLNQPFDPTDFETNFIPESVFNYCHRSKEVLVVGNATLDQRFEQDKTIRKQHVLSLACVPILSYGKLSAILYLENSQLADVFTHKRQQVIKHLSTQFGISVENAMLYDRINRNKKELEVSEKRFRSLVENAEESIFVGQDDYIKYANGMAEELTGYSAEEVMRMNFDKLIHPDDLKTVLAEYQARLSGEKPTNKYSTRIISKQGQTKYVYVNSARIDWDGRPATLALITDITQLKKAEEEVRQAYDEIKELKDQLQAESEYLQQEIKLEHNFGSIIGQSEALKYVLNRVEKVAPTDFPALIMGETGTGKELIARAIHELSPRSNRAMVKVNCAALPAELIESELFGREKGAYTGAATAQAGRFELANGSTLFLDEIGELPLGLQAKLLRVLESGEFERLGSSRTLHSDARIIAATNRVLEEEVHNGRFRDDLWYRIKVFPITVPPLRERSDDIPMLMQSFLDELCRKMGKPLPKISAREMKLLQKYPWPGNVRELRHSIESALINAEGNKLSFEFSKIVKAKHMRFKSFKEMERDYILQVLKAKQWRIGGPKGAASALDLNVNTLRGKMEKLDIKKRPFS